MTKVQYKQNHSTRLIFLPQHLATRQNTAESAFPLLNVLDVLTVSNVYRIHASLAHYITLRYETLLEQVAN